jgi:DNA-binding MarR family transcriptional regulator
MNIKQFKTNLENVKKYTPQVYKETMQLSIPFFLLHKVLFEKGDNLLKEEFSLNQSELDILAALYYMTKGSFTMSPTELYEVMFFSSGGMTKVLKKLESKNFIIRVDNETDKRSKLVKLTNKGKEITSNALKKIVAFEDRQFSKLNKEEQDLLKKLLFKIIKE